MTEKLASPPTPLRRAVGAVKPAVTTAIIFSFFINVLTLISPLYMLQVYDRVLASGSVSTLVALSLAAIGLYAVYGVLEALRTQVLVRAGLKFDALMRDAVFGAVLWASLRRRGAGGQAFRDMDTVREFMTGGLIAFCDLPWTPVFVLIAFVLHPYFGVLAIVSCAIMFGLALANDRVTRSPLQQASAAAVAAQSDAGATLRNAEVLQAMGMWGGLQARWRGRRDEQIGWQAAASDRGGAILATIKVFRQIVQTLILGGGAFLVIKGQLSPGSMIAGSILVGSALRPIETAVSQWKGLIGAKGAWSKLQVLLTEAPQATDTMDLPVPEGRLAVENACILAPGSTTPSVRNVTFNLEPGMTMAIVGQSAAGKSSLARGLVGVWPCVVGKIRLDGFDITQWRAEALGQHIGYLPQDIELFSGTVGQNIARFTDPDPKAIMEAANLAGVHTMIQQLPKGYDTEIGEGGAVLSGGQRQRVALARAVYKSPALIVLDEPNASLDSTGEAALLQAITRLKTANRTVIFTTHKVSLLGVADYVLVVNGGVVVQAGPRDDVLASLMNATSPATPIRVAQERFTA